MTVFIFILLGLVILVAGYIITLYNNLVALKHRVSQAWSNIDILLKQRHEELPKLVATCKEYMEYEQATLERVISARNMVPTPPPTTTLPHWVLQKPLCAKAWDSCLHWRKTTPT